MNLTDAGNTHGIIVDLVISKGYRIRLNVDDTDDTIVNYWLAGKENKIIQTKEAAFPVKKGDWVFYANYNTI